MAIFDISVNPKIMQIKTFLFAGSDSFTLLVRCEGEYDFGVFGLYRFLIAAKSAQKNEQIEAIIFC